MLRKYKTITSTKLSSKFNPKAISLGERRAKVKIAVIDDNVFPANDNLKSYGYNIVQLGDISNISEVKNYDIVLCDVMGVGSAFDPDDQGARIIAEIRANYPSTYVLAYTGNLSSNPQALTAKAKADFFIDKDADMEKWTETLDSFIERVLDPVSVWKRARKNLVNIELDTFDILKLEDAYVRDLLDNDEKFSRLHKLEKTLNLSGMAKSIVTGVIAKTIVGLIVA